MSNRRSRSVPKKKKTSDKEEDVDDRRARHRASSASPHSTKKKTSQPAASKKAKASKERRKQNNPLDKRPPFNLDTTIEYDDVDKIFEVDKNGRIRRKRDYKLEGAERQKRKQEQEEYNQSWSNSLRGGFYEEED